MKVQHGDIVISHSHGFISIAIQFFMNLWRWVNWEFEPLYKKVPNHIGMGDTGNRVIEAVSQGIKRNRFDNIDTKSTQTIKVYRYPWSIRQEQQINKYYAQYEGTPYQYVNFLQYIPYILTVGILWLGRRGNSSDNKLYCSEFAARIIHKITSTEFAKSSIDLDAHIYFRDYWKISPLQVARWCEVNCELVVTYEIKDGIITEIK